MFCIFRLEAQRIGIPNALVLPQTLFLSCPSERTEWLDNVHVVFGNVISGLDVVRRVEKTGSKSGKPSERSVIANCGELA